MVTCVDTRTSAQQQLLTGIDCLSLGRRVEQILQSAGGFWAKEMTARNVQAQPLLQVGLHLPHELRKGLRRHRVALTPQSRRAAVEHADEELLHLHPASWDAGQHVLPVLHVVGQALQRGAPTPQHDQVAADKVEDVEVLETTPRKIADIRGEAKQAAPEGAKVYALGLQPLEIRAQRITLANVWQPRISATQPSCSDELALVCA